MELEGLSHVENVESNHFWLLKDLFFLPTVSVQAGSRIGSGGGSTSDTFWMWIERGGDSRNYRYRR